MTTIFGRLTELNVYFNIIPKAKKLLIDKLQNLFSIIVNISIKSNDLPTLNDKDLPQLENKEEIIDTEVSNDEH